MVFSFNFFYYTIGAAFKLAQRLSNHAEGETNTVRTSKEREPDVMASPRTDWSALPIVRTALGMKENRADNRAPPDGRRHTTEEQEIEN